MPLEYRGEEAEEDFLVGFGLDYAERYRNLPSILVVDPDALSADRESFEELVFGPRGAFSDAGPRD